MAINTTNATMQMRRGNESDFDPDKMAPGEWAASLDKKYVRMCFAPGLCIRMATYDAFEEDMKEVAKILENCQNIEDVVLEYGNVSKSWAVGGTNTREGEDLDNSKYYSEQSKVSADKASDYLDMVNNAIGADMPNFQVDLSTGHLLYSGGRFEFVVINGNLMWGLTV